MTEYHYHEFVAVDGPISDAGLRYARGCSSRAEVSRFRWRNVYHFGDFHGSAEKLLNYYDAHFYIAKWATVRLGLALPAATLPRKAVEPYLRGGERHEDTLTLKEVGDRCIVWWERNEEGGWWEAEGEGAIDALIGVREELLRGDYRALFLGWPPHRWPPQAPPPSVAWISPPKSSRFVKSGAKRRPKPRRRSDNATRRLEESG